MSVPGSLADLRARRKRDRLGAEDLLDLAAERNRSLDDEPEPIHAFLSCVRNGDDAGANRQGEEEERAAAQSPANATALTEAWAEDGPVGGGRRAGIASPLDGMPIGVKDNICTLELTTSCASRILRGYRSPFEATAVRRLRAAGARLFGKTNCDEFAMGSSTEHSAFGPTRNPVDRGRVPGGSSGGSAAAVAAGVVPVALGSSTGGSVRQPASFCGVVGIKPTYGRVSRYGLVAFGSSLDQIGVLARTVEDAAAVLEIISGGDPRDATCQDWPVPRATDVEEIELAGATIGLPEEYLGEGLDADVRDLVEAAVERMEAAGARVRRVRLPHAAEAIPSYYITAPAEASSNLARFDGVRYGVRAPDAPDVDVMIERTRGSGFGSEVKRRILVGTYALSAGYYDAYYLQAQHIRYDIGSDLEEVFAAGVDALFAPTTPTPAFRLGEHEGDPYRMYLADVYTVAANLTGIPSVSIPIGNVDGLPVGGQFMCPHREETRMLGLARDLEAHIAYEHPLDGALGW